MTCVGLVENDQRQRAVVSAVCLNRMDKVLEDDEVVRGSFEGCQTRLSWETTNG
jgi:hypothetical protein